MNAYSERGCYLADLYCGTGGVGFAARRKYRMPAKLYDTIFGPDCDLTIRSNIRKL